MEKRYQVFVSSTFNDLKTERQHATWALQAMECIPSGMELFPASDDDQWTLIKKVIVDCDYYLLILAGRYGSLDQDGIGYTEKEYDYALSQRKPIIAFLHADPRSLPLGNSEEDPELRKKLEVFREKVKRKMVQFWTSPEDLAVKISTSLHALIKSHPAGGWVKAEYAMDTEEVQRLSARVKELERELASRSAQEETSPSLQPEAIALLKEAAESATGRISAYSDLEGLQIMAGDFSVNDSDNRRLTVFYKHIIKILNSNGYIDELSEGLYELTEAGYKIVEGIEEPPA